MSFSEMVAMAPADLYKNSSLQSYFLCLLAQVCSNKIHKKADNHGIY